MTYTMGGAIARREATAFASIAKGVRLALVTMAGIGILSVSPYAGAQAAPSGSTPASGPASKADSQGDSNGDSQAGSQRSPEPALRAPSRAPLHIQWRLLVLLDGQQVDSFSGNTAVGQSQTATHRHAASHPVGCEGAQTVPTDLSRTVSVSPLGVDSSNVIGFEISTDDVIEDPTARAVQVTGCALPPQTRTISARHPELDVASGKTGDWVLLKKQPQLIYRLEASVAATGLAQ